MERLPSVTNLNKLGIVLFWSFLYLKTQAQNAIKDSIPYIDPQTFFTLLETQHPELYTNNDGNKAYKITLNHSDPINQLIKPVRTNRQKKKGERKRKRIEQ